MLKVPKQHYLLINIVLLAAGLVAVVLGMNWGSRWQPVMESLGIGLIAAAAVNLLDQIFKVDEPPEGEKIILAAQQRSQTPPDIYNEKFRARKVDIIGITLNHALEELMKDEGKQIIDRLLYHNLQLRVFFVHPNSEFLKQRAIEDIDEHKTLVTRQREGVERCVEFYGLLKKRYEDEKRRGKLDTRRVGSLQIKLLNFCPYISVFRLDDNRIYWGLYTSGTTGLNLPLFLTMKQRDPDLYAHLHTHIHGLMDRDKEYGDLVSMTNVGAPVLNQVVLKRAMENRSSEEDGTGRSEPANQQMV